MFVDNIVDIYNRSLSTRFIFIKTRQLNLLIAKTPDFPTFIVKSIVNIQEVKAREII